MKKDEDRKAEEREQERRHREGYERIPAEPGEFGEPEELGDWEDDEEDADRHVELPAGAAGKVRPRELVSSGSVC
jgi:hypothetical protein